MCGAHQGPQTGSDGLFCEAQRPLDHPEGRCGARRAGQLPAGGAARDVGGGRVCRRGGEVPWRGAGHERQVSPGGTSLRVPLLPVAAARAVPCLARTAQTAPCVLRLRYSEATLAAGPQTRTAGRPGEIRHREGLDHIAV